MYTAILTIYQRAKYRSLARPFGLDPRDLAAYAIERVITHTHEYLGRSPQHVANARAENAFFDLCRRERADRGEGSRGTRSVINDRPVNPSDRDSGTLVERVRESEGALEKWIQRDYYNTILENLRTAIADEFAWQGYLLTEIEGLTQADAAKKLGVTREKLNRTLGAARGIAIRHRQALGWEGYW